MKANSLPAEEQTKLLTNTFGIQLLEMSEDIQHACPLGEQTGVTHYEIEVEPGEHLAELCQLHWDIQKLIGQVFTLESGCAKVLDIVKDAYADAHYVRVTAICGMNRHMPVKATKSWCGDWSKD